VGDHVGERRDAAAGRPHRRRAPVLGLRTSLDDGVPAPRARRAVARAADALTVFAVLWVLVVLQILWFMDEVSERVDPEPWGRAFPATVAYVVLAVAYEVVFLRWNRGVTPGKDMARLRVVAVRGHGDEHAAGVAPGLGAGRAAARALVAGGVWMIPPVWLAVAAAVALGAPIALPGRRSVADLVAGTRVVVYDRDRAEREAELADRPTAPATDRD
jgi:uncharacterized RDD family membrane protein YckC